MFIERKLSWIYQLHSLARYDLILKLQLKNIKAFSLRNYINIVVIHPGLSYIYIVRFISIMIMKRSSKFNFFAYVKKPLQLGQKKIKRITAISLYRKDMINSKTSLLLSFFFNFFLLKFNFLKILGKISEEHASFKIKKIDSFTLAELLNITGDRDWLVTFKFNYVSKYMFYYSSLFKIVHTVKLK
jgi:hypothetical protein